MSKLQYDPSAETRLQATLRVIREAYPLEDFVKKRKFGEALIKEFQQTMDNVSGKMMKNKWDAEYLKQLDYEIHLIRETIDRRRDELTLKK